MRACLARRRDVEVRLRRRGADKRAEGVSLGGNRIAPSSGASGRRFDGRAVLIACGASAAAAVVLEWLGSDAYRSVLGIGHPAAATVVVATLGFFGLEITVRRSWVPSETGVVGGWAKAALIGGLLPIPVIVVDWFGGFGPEINARAPDSLLFYPSVALLAEFAFHVAPLAVAAVVADLRGAVARAAEAAGLLVATSIEPILQVVWGTGHSPWWANAYVGLHLLVFNVVGLYLLRRYGFMRVYLYRVSYYSVWHILWGHVRLGLLFAS